MKMTEKEFREALAKHPGFVVEGSRADRAVAVAIEAGLEFAPEPVELPERIGFARDGTDVFFTEANGCRFTSFSTEFRMLVAAVVVDRYNAYPGLRRAAEKLLEAVDRCLPDRSLVAAASLQAELAKGPK